MNINMQVEQQAEQQPELNQETLPMPELAQQLLAFATEAYDSRGNEDIVSWSVAIQQQRIADGSATYQLLDRPTDYDEPVIVLNFKFNVRAANIIAGDPIRAKLLYDIAVINAMIEQLYVENEDDGDDWSYNEGEQDV